jgi:hypothetical protein
VPGPARLMRYGLALAVSLSVALLPSQAWGWVEKTFESDGVTVDIERDGSAVVSHEILLFVRGGPLPEVALEPVDADAEPLPEATATLAKSGAAAGWPIPLSMARDGSRIRLHVLEGKGLRSGKYQIRFRYRTSLPRAGRIHPGTQATEIEWSGIGFPDGIDSAKVVFRLPRGATPPRLATSAPSDRAEGVADDQGGVFLSTLRRNADKDELDVVRPHVAKNEIVLWRAVADRTVFDLAPADTALPPAPTPATFAPAGSSRHAPPTSLPLILGGLAASLYALLLVLKARSVESACSLRRARPRPLLPLALPFRAVIAALGLGGAVTLFLSVPFPSVAAASLLVTILAATHLPPGLVAALRGPGKWVRLTGDAAFDGDEPLLPGRLLDVGCPLGFVLFTALLMGFVAAAVVVMRRSPYHGVALALGSSVLFPIFFTGRSGELPLDSARAPRVLLEWLTEALGRDSSLESHPIGRVPLGGTAHDELRLLVTPKRSIQGLVAIEVGVDFHAGPLGFLSLPFVLVRVVEGMPAADILPKGLFWTRGRAADERVTVLRPKVPTRRLSLELTRDVARRFTLAEPARRQPRTSAAKASGSGSATLKVATSSSGVHAT